MTPSHFRVFTRAEGGGLSAHVAFMRAFSRVDALVNFEVARRNESPSAHVALMRAFSRVDVHVPNEIALMIEGLFAHVALMRAFSCMSVETEWKPFCTHRIDEGYLSCGLREVMNAFPHTVQGCGRSPVDLRFRRPPDGGRAALARATPPPPSLTAYLLRLLFISQDAFRLKLAAREQRGSGEADSPPPQAPERGVADEAF
ncbi:Protein of unknown function [Gryllus bimaculatus]|nr:Protein of unknown function [Gryllus bimaculatus]